MADENEEKKFADEPVLTPEEVWDVVSFARAMSGMYGNVYLNPDLVSGRMKDITLNPLAATEAMLASAQASPKENEKNLQEFSQSFELSSMVYKRLIAYLANMLAFDITYTSTAEGDDYSTPKYKKDITTVERFLDKFDYKKEFRVVLKEMLRNDAYFGCFIDTGNNFVLQELPSEYCKITGRWSGGFLFSFNMYWFIQPGVDINMYPPFFKKKFNQIWQDANTTQRYDPALPPELRGKSSWIYWVDVPTTVGTCFKLTPELATRLPYFSPLFNDLVLQGLMRNLQKNLNMAVASKIIIGEVPMLNKEIKATVKDSIAISPDLLGKFMALVKSALSDAIKVASAPLQNISGIDFDDNNDMYDSYMRTTLASSGINTNLIFTSNVKPNAIETQLSLNVDEQMMTTLYEQFNDFMNYWVNKYTRTYKFNFVFEGTDFYLNRQDRFDKQMTLFDKGIIMPQKIAAAMGMKPAEFRKHMEESKANNFMDSLTPPSFEQQKETLEIQNKNANELADKQIAAQKEAAKLNQKITTTDRVTTGDGVKTATKSVSTPATKPSADKGRPKMKDSELGDEGLATRDQASNIGRGGKPR